MIKLFKKSTINRGQFQRGGGTGAWPLPPISQDLKQIGPHFGDHPAPSHYAALPDRKSWIAHAINMNIGTRKVDKNYFEEKETFLMIILLTKVDLETNRIP